MSKCDMKCPKCEYIQLIDLYPNDEFYKCEQCGETTHRNQWKESHAMKKDKEKNLPQFVLYEPDYVGWKDLIHAIKDAQNLKVPLKVNTEAIFQAVYKYIRHNKIDIEVILEK